MHSMEFEADLKSDLKTYLKTAMMGRTLYYQAEVDSTNLWARRLAEQGAPEGTLVIAESQSKGKGRLGRSWASPPGLGLWISFILRPRINLAALAGITTVTAVAMAEAVYTVTGIQLQLKWPNDLWGAGRKLGGILAEVKGEQEQINFLVVGIGVNVNHLLTDFPVELDGKATSLRILKGDKVSRPELLGEFLTRFEAAYGAISGQGLTQAIEYARLHSITLGKTVTINRGFGEKITGEAVDLEQDGSLWLKCTGGEMMKLHSGEIIETV
ncbi:MAG TPA: biotin--[acetyl-CoA-carboxylase] ligase [Bacillota bacterium]|nr:biotin--[acetyl-CoA-carboxylase] ligase [Bacillota bacterium]